jgi:8-oxo-dGTP pyrophosphatase MutT (NUDIX family)
MVTNYMDNLDVNLIAKIILIDYKNGKVLLLRSKKLNKYHLPGGHLQKNETFSQGIKRELKEETNLTLKNFRVFYSKPYFKLYIGVAYPNIIKLSDEHDDYVWASIDKLHTYPLCTFTIKDMYMLKKYWFSQKRNRLKYNYYNKIKHENNSLVFNEE